MNPNELKVEVFRGKHDQEDARTNSGIRITHIPTGCSAESEKTMSQRYNYAYAYAKLDRLVKGQTVEGL